jgi:hypothetical protein
MDKRLLLAVVFWGQTQSFIENYNNLPLVSANWEGNYKPYVVKNSRYEPLIDASVMNAYKDWDFYSPQVLDKDLIVMSGSKYSGPNFDVFLYNTKTKDLTNLTGTPNIDEGGICVNKKRGIISYRSEASGQIVVKPGQMNLNKKYIPKFKSCSWVDKDTLVGVTTNTNKFYVCKVSDDVSCKSMDFEPQIFWVGAWNDTCITLMTSKNDFRRPWCYSKGKLKDIPFNVKADVLDYDRSSYRLGSKGRYSSSVGDDDGSIIFYTKKIGGVWYSILGNTNTSRSLAVKNGKKWQPVYYYDKKPGVVKPKELWIKDVQAFYWSVPNAQKAMIWVHGGPKESISPRFNPYYSFLNSIGFNVLAVNYPGSTSRGNTFELKFDPALLSASISDCVAFLRKNKIQTVVLWGVSTGNKVVLYSLNKELPIDGIIDQAGFDNARLFELSNSLRIPYFSIRGKYDTYNPAIPVNFMYEGGHDITREQDFVLLTDAIKKFLLVTTTNKKRDVE